MWAWEEWEIKVNMGIVVPFTKVRNLVRKTDLGWVEGGKPQLLRC